MGRYRSTSILTVILVALFSGKVARAEIPAGFPVEACDCTIELRDAEALFDHVSGREALLGGLDLIDGEGALRLLLLPIFNRDPFVRQCLLQRSVLGTRGVGDAGDEWVAWIGLDPDDPERRRELIAALGPVRDLKGLICLELGVVINEVAGGLLISSTDSNDLRQAAIDGLATGVPDTLPAARTAQTSEASLIITLVHDEEGPGGSSVLAAAMEADVLRLDYHGRFTNREIEAPGILRRLDVEVLDRLPDDVIAMIVEHSDSGIVPGAEVISKLLPYLVEPELSDERRSRRLVVVTEGSPDPELPDGLRMPEVAVAIEVDGPGASARRQDLKVLASLNNLRNRLGGQAGLQHLPDPDSFPEKGTRTIYTRALFDPAFDGHPMARSVSVNWCQTGGETCWQLYATSPDLANQLASSLESETGIVSCVSASHVGRLDADRALDQLDSWGQMAGAFVGRERAPEFTIGIQSLGRLLESVAYMDWVVTIPDRNSLDVVLRLHAVDAGRDQASP